MQFVSGWATLDKRILANFDDKVLDVFRQHIQCLGSDAEAGGLLLGEVRGGHLNLVERDLPDRRRSEVAVLVRAASARSRGSRTEDVAR